MHFDFALTLKSPITSEMNSFMYPQRRRSQTIKQGHAELRQRHATSLRLGFDCARKEGEASLTRTRVRRAYTKEVSPALPRGTTKMCMRLCNDVDRNADPPLRENSEHPSVLLFRQSINRQAISNTRPKLHACANRKTASACVSGCTRLSGLEQRTRQDAGNGAAEREAAGGPEQARRADLGPNHSDIPV